MGRTVRALILSALMLFGAGLYIYSTGSRLNAQTGDRNSMLWDQAPGDKWLYVGGLMMLISGSLAGAALRFWKGDRREQRAQR